MTQQAPPIRESAWHPAKDAQLAALMADGIAFREIGERMGMSKNAVLGRAHRLGLAHPNAVGPRTGLSPTLERLKALDVFPDKGECRFPIGHPGSPEFRFCGAATSAQPYCSDHARVAFLNASTLSPEEKAALHRKMAAMRAAKGAK